MSTTAEATWPPPWVRAALGTAILATLETGAQHGYGIAVALEGRGFGRPKGGSLYPLLNALERDGAVSASWSEGTGGPGRRDYTLTSAGRHRLEHERANWAALVTALFPDQGSAHPFPQLPGSQLPAALTRELPDQLITPDQPATHPTSTSPTSTSPNQERAR